MLTKDAFKLLFIGSQELSEERWKVNKTMQHFFWLYILTKLFDFQPPQYLWPVARTVDERTAIHPISRYFSDLNPFVGEISS